MKFKRFSAVFALILAVILSLGLLTSCFSETDGTDDIVSIEKDTATETTGTLDFINREPAKDEETTKSPDTTNAPETLGSVEDLKSPETEKAPETTVHEHNFLLATCTAPKTQPSAAVNIGHTLLQNYLFYDIIDKKYLKALDCKPCL